MNRARTLKKNGYRRDNYCYSYSEINSEKKNTSFVESGQSCLKGSTMCPRRHIGYKIQDPRNDIPLRQAPGSATRAPTSI